MVENSEKLAELKAKLEILLKVDAEEYLGLPGKVEDIFIDILTGKSAFFLLFSNEKKCQMK